jgi:hypothetical protein
MRLMQQDDTMGLNGTTQCDAGRGRWPCNGKEGGLLHKNQQKVGERVHVAKGEARQW